MSQFSDTSWLHRYTVLAAILTLLLIVAGALVTTKAAGDSLPGWPLAEGTRVLPSTWAGGAAYEFGHRVIAAIVALLTIGLVVWLWRKEPRRWVRVIGYLALGCLFAQSLMGGLRVLQFVQPYSSIVHAALAHAFFCMLVSLAVFTAPGWEEERSGQRPESPGVPLFQFAAAATLAAYVEILLGAGLRHGLFGLLPHIAAALVVAAIGLVVVTRVLSRHIQIAGLRHPALALALVLTLQLALGAGAYWARFLHGGGMAPLAVILRTAHVPLAGLVLAFSLVIALRSGRLLGVLGTPVMVSTGAKVAEKAV